ncbi:MAG TPA: SUMF1/EgtB/PvdO family nonheme iron enzyme [Bacteroidia bacterium]|nr:SUMF1/EgtB/PvdO family nonheme iron enzyme [Bacteroidia bacterium]
MEKDKMQSLSSAGLDQLINQAFLNLDFDQPQNLELMEQVSIKTLNRAGFFPSFNKLVFSKLVLFVAAFVLADGLSLCLKRLQHTPLKPVTSSEHTNKQAATEARSPEVSQTQPEALVAQKPISAPKRIQNNSVPLAVQEKITLSGTIHSAKTGEALKGAAVYKLNSDISVSTNGQGYYSLQMPKGEHNIVVALLGYQTYTFSLYSEEDVRKNVALKEEWKSLEEVVVKPDAYIFPVLTEKEKKANEKEKQKMAKLVARAKPIFEKSADKYPYIPPPADQAFSGFNMGSNEVTNLEYRTFLFDLLIHGKKDEFLLAKPEQHLWINAADQSLFDTLAGIYFSEKKYNYNPVVNISLKGAQLYCTWLCEQANLLKRKAGEPAIMVRLPYESEWLHAASAGRAGAVYPWLRDSVQNSVNWFLANCCIQKQPDKLRYPFNKTKRNPSGDDKKFDRKAYTAAGMTLANNRIATVDVFAYNPNDFYLYCMSGNVSELVYSNDAKTFKAKGGNWSSDAEHLKLNSEDEFKTVSASPMIGFRVCITSGK